MNLHGSNCPKPRDSKLAPPASGWWGRLADVERRGPLILSRKWLGHGRSGVMIAPLSGSYDGIPKLVLHATDASEMLDLCNDLAGGNICHVLCDIGSAEAVEALGKVASLAAKALFSKPMQTGCLLHAADKEGFTAHAPQCLRAVLQHAPGALQFRIPPSNGNLPHLAAQRRTCMKSWT